MTDDTLTEIAEECIDGLETLPPRYRDLGWTQEQLRAMVEDAEREARTHLHLVEGVSTEGLDRLSLSGLVAHLIGTIHQERFRARGLIRQRDEAEAEVERLRGPRAA